MSELYLMGETSYTVGIAVVLQSFLIYCGFHPLAGIAVGLILAIAGKVAIRKARGGAR